MILNVRQKRDMLERYHRVRDRFTGLKHQLEKAQRNLRSTAINLVFMKSDRNSWILTRDFFIEVAKYTQAEITNYFEDTMSLALSAIPSEHPLRLVTNLETRRNQPELDLFIKEGEGDLIPLLPTIDTVGNSVEELIAFAAKLCMLSIHDPLPEPFMVQDEPFRALKEENFQAVTKVIKELQDELGIQMLILTHRDEMSVIADKVLYVDKRGGKTIVKER